MTETTVATKRKETQKIERYFEINEGGYLALKYIARDGNPFMKIALRCPAVNMYSVLTNTIMNPEEYEKIQKGKAVPVGFDRKIDVCLQFLKELHS